MARCGRSDNRVSRNIRLSAATASNGRAHTSALSQCATAMLVGVTLIVVLVLVACGGSGSSAPSKSAATPASLVLSPTTALIKVGGTQQLSATVRFSDGTTQTATKASWSSANKAIATVNPTGTVTGVAGGTTTITATDSGVTGQATVTVAASAPPGGSGSGSTGITDNKAYIAIPSQNCQGDLLSPANPNTVAVVDLGATADTSGAIDHIAMPANYVPTMTVANNGQVLVTSCSSSTIQIIDATTDKIVGTADAPVTTSVTFSGGSCIICGIVFDPSTKKAILDTAEGVILFDPSTKTFSAPVPGSLASENFGYDPASEMILNPVYNNGGSGFQVIDLRSNSVANFTAPSMKPDASAIDSLTHIGLIPDETSKTELFLNLNFSSGSNPPSVSFIQQTTCNELTMVSIDSSVHQAALASEDGTDCFALELLPTTAPAKDTAPPLPSAFIWGHMPTLPNGNPWQFGLDPHSLSMFTSSTDGSHFVFLVNKNANWVARINLAALAGANPNNAGINLKPYVAYLQTF